MAACPELSDANAAHPRLISGIGTGGLASEQSLAINVTNARTITRMRRGKAASTAADIWHMCRVYGLLAPNSCIWLSKQELSKAEEHHASTISKYDYRERSSGRMPIIGGNAAINGDADIKVMFADVLKRGLSVGVPRCASGNGYRCKQTEV